MKFSATVLLAAALSGVSARPSAHQAHQLAHRSLEVRDVVKAVKPAPPAPTEPKKQPPAPVQDKVAASSGGGVFKPFCNGQKAKRATLDQIMYAGNTGTPDNYGCNMMLVDDDVVDKYDYTIKLRNAGGEDQQCVGFLKIGPDGGVNGFFKDNEALKFKLPAKGTLNMAVDANTQGGVICQAGEIETTLWGEYASTWLEIDMGSEPNDGWSGADASCLTASRQGMKTPGLKVCGSGTCSTIFSDGSGVNAFTKGMEAEDGHGLNLPAGKVRLDVIVDYSG